MNILKIKKKVIKRIDKYFTTVLLKNIKPLNINESDYIIVFNELNANFFEKLYILISHQLSQKDIPSCFLYKNDLLKPYYPPFHINGLEISNSINLIDKRSIQPMNKNGLHYDWAIDIEMNKIIAEGINFFQIINNTLRSVQKRYNVIFYDENNKPVYNDLIQFCDLLLKYFLLLKDYSHKKHKKIRIVGWEASYVPNGVFWLLCDKLSHNRDIEFVELTPGYMEYFGKHHFRSSNVNCSNRTKTRSSDRLSFSKDELAEVNEKNIEFEQLSKPISSAIKKEITAEKPNSYHEMLNLLIEYQAQGKNIFVLFAHLFYDTPVNDESPAFDGMCDWIIETINFFNGKNDILLLKPHPVELMKDEPKKIPNETLESFVRNIEMSKNIFLLEPNSFTINELAPFTSCGLIWRSSVAMELAFLEIPCIIAGNPYYNALDLVYCRDKQHYFDLINEFKKIKVTEKQRIEVANYQYLLKSKHFHIDCIFYDKNLRNFYWSPKALKRYLKKGEESIFSIVDHVLS
jgi:hypothetical protein